MFQLYPDISRYIQIYPPVSSLFLQHILDDTSCWRHLLTELDSSTGWAAAHCAAVTTTITLDTVPLTDLPSVHNERNDGTDEPTDETEETWAWLHVLGLVIQVTGVTVQGVTAHCIHRITAVTQSMLPLPTGCSFVCHPVCWISSPNH